jgi:hypothetical protein
MPSVLQLREEQPGVVGTTATVWLIQDGKLRRQRLVNDRVVAEESRELTPAEIERVRSALGQASFSSLPALSARPVEANVGKLVLEADGKRWETPYRAGATPTAQAAGSPEARLLSIASTIRTLAPK